MSTELFTLTLAFRGLSDDPEANDENTDMGEETNLDDEDEDDLDGDGAGSGGTNDDEDDGGQTME